MEGKLLSACYQCHLDFNVLLLLCCFTFELLCCGRSKQVLCDFPAVPECIWGCASGESVLSIHVDFWHAILSPLFRKPMRIAVLRQPAQQDNPKIRQILSSPEIVQHQHLQQHQIPKQMAAVLCRITMLSLLLQGPEMRSSYQIQCMEFCFSPGKRWSRSSKVGLPSS